MASLKVGVIIGSQRVLRSCPQVAQFALDVVKKYHVANPQPKFTAKFELVDIASYQLGIGDIADLPSKLDAANLPNAYHNSEKESWSSKIASCDAFIFVTPQYNWGMPAALKNALDHLFHEWGGKPAMVISYGGHGGTIGAAQLITVLSGMFVKVIKRPVCMKYDGRDMMVKAIKAEGLGLDAENADAPWSSYKTEIEGLWQDMSELMLEERKLPKTRADGLDELWLQTLEPARAIEAKQNN